MQPKSHENSPLGNTLSFFASFVDFKCIIGGVDGELTAPSEFKAS